jgi:zearalenone synthase (highly reducing iterative type I polyketide synthase)
LCTIAELDGRKTVFIQGGGTVLGHLGATLAIELGATVFASVQSEEESLALQNIGLPASHLLNSNDVYQASTMKHFMGRESGPDVIFNTNGSEDVVEQLWPCLGQGGKFVDVFLTDASTNLNLAVEPFRHGATFGIFNLQDTLQTDILQYQKIREKAMSFIRSQRSASFPSISMFTADQAQQALESVGTSSGQDSAVLLFSEDVVVPILPEDKTFLQLSPDATYVLAGGLGGLGRSLARLMVDSGARHLVFLSRSGPGSAAANSIIEEFVPRDVKVAVHGCDITDAESLAQAFNALSDDPSLPPVRGIVQCAAVLRDSIFENMTYAQWTEALRPKIQGTWNLHQASLSKPCASEGLDFFVMLASISGFVGNRGQANYAAGNSYQDALAHHRRSLGLAATSVDLGLMQDIGLIAEQGGHSNLKDDTVVPLGAKDFELIFKLVLGGNQPDVPAQIITGLPTGGILQHLGVDSSPFYFRDARFTQMQSMGLDESLRGHKDGHDSSASAEERLGAADAEQASIVVLEILRDQIAKTLRCSADDIDATKPLHAYGVDSLMAVDLRAWFLTRLKAEVALFEILSGGSIQLLADKIAKASKLVK